ncbi:hypothetical protein MNBD_ALPHA03-2073 [hydrothermal vent metagenome]|uniref:Uncharacterized protein n=2 Tax=hydrothermal vent metagenome TaxID=652676 RepID=A0A3B1AHQ8_9ZZZZ
MIEKPDPDTDVGYEGIAGASCQFTGVNEDFEIIFNAVGAGNMNRAKVSNNKSTDRLNTPSLLNDVQLVY